MGGVHKTVKGGVSKMIHDLFAGFGEGSPQPDSMWAK